MSELYDVSIVCVYNNDSQYQGLVDSLRKQTVSFELIGLDNRASRWKSAASAYNYGLRVAQAPIVLFSHQDMVFLDDSFLREFVAAVSDDPQLVMGVAGASLSKSGHGRDLLSAMYQGDTRRRHATITDRAEAMTLDECLFGCSKRVLERISFDESACDGWHFYAVDFSLQALLAGFRVEVMPAEVLHLSGGTRDDSYYLAQEKIKAKYKGAFEVIATTCGWTRTADIDPYRPIVSDELRALRAKGISYDLNFYHNVQDSLSLESEDFFPSIEEIATARSVRCRPCDESVFADVRSSSCDANLASLEAMIVLGNALKLKRWVSRDLLALKEGEVDSVRLEYESSKSYGLGTRLLPWAKVDAARIIENCADPVDTEPKLESSYDSVGSTERIGEYVDACMVRDPDSLTKLVESVCDQVIGTTSDSCAVDRLARSAAERLRVDGLEQVREIASMQHALNRIDRCSAALRMAYEESGAYRLGRAFAKFKGQNC